MSLNTHHCWAVVTNDESKANTTWLQILNEQAEQGNHCIKVVLAKDGMKYCFEDGTTIIWIKNKIEARGFRFHRLWCDINIDQDYFEQVILPMAVYMKYEDIVWI